MGDWVVPLADVVLDEDEIAAVVEVYRSGWLSIGPRTEELESRLADYTGARHAIAVSSGTAALHLMCCAVGLSPGDEVIVPSMTFVATANAVAYTGATPVFAEITSLTEPWLSVASVESRITERTRAVMAMSYGGYAGDVAGIGDLCRERGLMLLEDAAHGLGGRLDDVSLGTFGTAGAFSFFSNKNLAVGEGGAVVCDDDSIAERVRLLRSHGMTSLSWDRHRGHATAYDVVAAGFNYRIDEPRSALAAKRLERLDADNARRDAIVARYRESFDAAGIAYVGRTREGERPPHHLFNIVVDDPQSRFALREHLAARGVQSSIHYPAVHRFSIYAAAAADLPLTDAYSDRTVTLPLFPHLTEEQQGRVIEAVLDAGD